MTKTFTINILLPLLILFCTTTLSAQALWKGNGDGTSWNDAANWKDGAVPTAGALVEFADTSTITGIADAIPTQIKIKGGALVTLDLDITVGTGAEHAILITSGSQLILGTSGSNKTITLSPQIEKHGISIGASTENSSITIASGTTLNITQANAGFNIVSPSATFTNNGTVNFTGGKNGLKLAGIGSNNGTMNIGAITGKGIQMIGGTFVNNPTGTVTATEPGDDGIEVVGGSSFTNHGNINTTAKAGALGGNNGIAVGTTDQAGSFFNMATGIIIANGGVDSIARPINVLEMGTFNNSGNIICAGGNAASRIYTKGNVTNEVTGVMDMTDGKLNVNAGTFTNNGLIKSVRTGAGASVAEGATIINNGFYDYANGSFSGGSGTIQDNGLAANTSFDANGACTIDLANIATEWFDGGTSLGRSSADGVLSISQGTTFSANPVTLTTSIPGVAIIITNFCQEEVVEPMEPVSYTWDAGGNGTSWEDAANWDSDKVPPAGALVNFNGTATVSGTATNSPAQIKVKSGEITLNLDLSIGGDTIQSLVLLANTQVTIGDNRTINFAPDVAEHSINIGGAAENAQLIIGNGAVLNLQQGKNGINQVNPSAIITNNGTINISAGISLGMRLSGNLTNNGIINVAENTPKSIIVNGGTLANTGTITATKPGDDGIDIFGGGSVTNSGILNVIAKNGASGSNNGVSIGSAETTGTLTNMASGVIIASGGVDSTSRAIFVQAMGVLSNHGSITLSGGNASSRLYTAGSTTNQIGGVIDATDGKINVNTGTLSNYGLIKSVRASGSGISTGAGTTVFNFGFFDYANNNNFASGQGTIEDKGANVNATIDARGSCTADIAEAAYEWFDGTTSLGLATSEGFLSVAEGTITANPVALTTSIEGVIINIADFCMQEPVDTMPTDTSPTVISVYKWDGNGDGTSWNDAINWDNDIVPPTGALVELVGAGTITGTTANNPAQIKVRSGAVIILDMDLTVGGDTVQSLVLTPDAQLTLGSDGNNRTINLSADANEHAINMGGGAENAILTIANGTILNLVQAKNGINQVNPTSSIINNGNIAISNAVTLGMKLSGSFTNNGAIVISEVGTKGIQISGGSYLNNESGSITATNSGDDGIEIIAGGNFMNHGTINATAAAGAGSGNNPIAVGSVDGAGNFQNSSTGILIASGGVDSTSRAINVLEMGTFTNIGQITISGGNAASRLYTRGVTTNGMGGILDVTDGKVNVNAGTFTNYGLIRSTRTGTGISTAEGATATNNGFFNYTNNNNFAGGQGTVEDKGINLNDETQTTIDASGTCSVDIAEAAYEWFEGASSVGTADATGTLTFTNNVLLADSSTLTTSISGVSIKLINVCPEAVFITSIFEPSIEVVQLEVYPTLVSYQNELIIDLSNFKATNMTFDIFNINGQLARTKEIRSGQMTHLDISQLQGGMYVLKSRNTEKAMVARFVVAR